MCDPNYIFRRKVILLYVLQIYKIDVEVALG
jgi:hypothetical protein